MKDLINVLRTTDPHIDAGTAGLAMLKAADALSATPPAGWVACSERLPPMRQQTVLVHFVNEYGRNCIARAYFVQAYSEEAADFDFDGADEADIDELGDVWWPEGWYEFNENSEHVWRIREPITHWHALPLPPGTAQPSGVAGERVKK